MDDNYHGQGWTAACDDTASWRSCDAPRGIMTCDAPGRCSSRLWWAPRSAQAACICYVVAVCLLPWTMHALESDGGQLTVTLSYSMLSEWTQALQRADLLSSELASKLQTSQSDFERLKLELSKVDETLKQLATSLELWQQRSMTLESLLADWAQRLATLQISLDEARMKSDASSMLWSSYKTQSEVALKSRESEARGWRAAALILGGLAVVFAGVAVVVSR